MSVEVGRPTRVIGWYHSHPHITVMPSHVGEDYKWYSKQPTSCVLISELWKHRPNLAKKLLVPVDVRTQRMYQMLDPGFVGLIFSCFNEDGIKVVFGAQGAATVCSSNMRCTYRFSVNCRVVEFK